MWQEVKRQGRILKRFVFSPKEKDPILELGAGKGVRGSREMAIAWCYRKKLQEQMGKDLIGGGWCSENRIRA